MITAEQRLSAMNEERIRRRFEALTPSLDEKQRRLLAGAEALTYGVEGQERIASLVGLAKETVGRGMRELRHPESIEETGRIRDPGVSVVQALARVLGVTVDELLREEPPE